MGGNDTNKLIRTPMPKDNNSIKANELSNFQIKKFIVTVTAFWSAKNTAKIAIIKAAIKNSCTTASPSYRVAITKPPPALRMTGTCFSQPPSTHLMHGVSLRKQTSF
jgi:hypothetical protein